MTVRERTQQIESEWLSPKAAHSRETRGRARSEEDCPLRTPYQRDRDRILHCKAFRRLKHKTQVFLAPEKDHYRTRLTHTLEVSQIARTIARALRLNEDLTEAISLGHDLGHTPFGHAGERALRGVCSIPFYHYEQSARVVEFLENDGRGLNLTWEVIDGIKNHTSRGSPATLEGQVVRISDKIAYLNHDIDDAIRGGVLREDEIPSAIREALGDSHSRRINSLVASIADHSGDIVAFAPPIEEAFHALRAFMFEHVYRNPTAKAEEGKAEALVKKLYRYFAENTDRLPGEYARIAAGEGAERAALDYIAGMSDRYAVQTYHDLFIPEGWMV